MEERFMVRSINPLKMIVLVAAVIALTACTAAPVVEVTPTMAPEEIVELAVATLSARMTAEALANPTATEVPPTATPVPTKTTIPTATVPPEPTATSTAEFTNRAEWVYTSTFPENRREFHPNEHFNIAWGLKNVGNITWHPDYKLIRVGGDPFTDVTEIPLGKVVAPGETCQFTLGAFGSEDMNAHTTYWQLVDQSGYVVPGGAVSFTYQPI